MWRVRDPVKGDDQAEFDEGVLDAPVVSVQARQGPHSASRTCVRGNAGLMLLLGHSALPVPCSHVCWRRPPIMLGVAWRLLASRRTVTS